jgi:hypothetical protein
MIAYFDKFLIPITNVPKTGTKKGEPFANSPNHQGASTTQIMALRGEGCNPLNTEIIKNLLGKSEILGGFCNIRLILVH